MLEIAVATNSVKSAMRDSASSGSRRSCLEEAIITPHERPSTTIGALTDDRMPSGESSPPRLQLPTPVTVPSAS